MFCIHSPASVNQNFILNQQGFDCDWHLTVLVVNISYFTVFSVTNILVLLNVFKTSSFLIPAGKIDFFSSMTFSWAGIAQTVQTRYGIEGLGIEYRCGVRFSASVQTCPGPHPASYAMGTGTLLRVKRPERDVDHPPTSNAEVNERVELYLYSPSVSSWLVLAWTLLLPLTFQDKH